MNGKALSAVLSDLPEDMIAEAMTPAPKRRSIPWLRLAACAAVIVGLFLGFYPTGPEIVTAPGLLTITVYAKDEDGQGYIVTEIDKGVNAARKQENECVIDGEPIDPIGISLYLNMDTEEFPAEEILYDVKVERGVYFDYSSGDYIRNLGREFVKTNPSFVSWHPMFSLDDDPNAKTNPEYDRVYTEIIIRCENNIIGFALLRFDREYSEFGGTTNYDPCFVASVLFPKQMGKYQDVTEEYVADCIENAKNR